jgi:murein DD-endopeptidase MepM/ murein hydrolase activator NlpD
MANPLDKIIAETIGDASPDQRLWAAIVLKRGQNLRAMFKLSESLITTAIAVGTVAIMLIPKINTIATDLFQDAIGSPQIPTAAPGKIVFPIAGTTLKTANVSSGYGPRQIFGAQSFHHGIDIAAPIGTPVVAPEAATIVKVWEQDTGGKVIEMVPISDGSKTIKYLHLNAQYVKASQVVKAGQIIGTVGNTGRSTGPHLDIRIQQNGAWIDPTNYLENAGQNGK